MKREIFLISVMSLVWSFAPAAVAQDVQSRPTPVQPSGTLGPALIVWSQAQKPQPLNQEEPSSRRSQPERAPQTAEKDSQPNEQKPAVPSVPITPPDQNAK